MMKFNLVIALLILKRKYSFSLKIMDPTQLDFNGIHKDVKIFPLFLDKVT